MKVSIIVPVYNVRNYLERCVDSLINQTYQEIEIILVNDGSTDGTEKIMEKYQADPRVILVNKENGGVSDARNVGLRHMSGSHVLFVDGDDFLEKNCVQVLMDYGQRDVDVVLFPYMKEYVRESEKAELFSDGETDFGIEDVKEKIYARLIGPRMRLEGVSPATMDRLNTVWGKLYKRGIIDGIAFTDMRDIVSEDGWFNIQVFGRVKSAVYTEKTYYHYEKSNSSSLLHTYNRGLMEKRWRLYAYMKEHLGNELKIYEKNLANRIVCEQFGTLGNIVNSRMCEKEKRIAIKKLLNDERYAKYYVQSEIKDYKVPWSLFYMMCHKKNVQGIRLFFAVMKVVKTVRKR